MQGRRASVLLAGAVAAAILACGGLLLLGGAGLPAAAGASQKVEATPMAAQGVVRIGPLGVRVEPAVTSPVVGTLPAGSQVNIMGQHAGWYLIEYARAPGGKGWVSARFLQVGSGITSLGAAGGSAAGAPEGSAAGVVGGEGSDERQAPAPEIIDYRPPVLRWKWAGDTGALAGKDWFFDILVIRKFEAYPYWTQFVEPPGKAQGARQQGDRYSVTIQTIEFRCDSSFAVQVARRESGRFAEWMSPRSNLLPFTRACPQSTPAPRPRSAQGGDQEIEKPLRPGGWPGDEGQTNLQATPAPMQPDAAPGEGGETNPQPEPPPDAPADEGGETNPQPAPTPVDAPPESTAVPTP